MVLDSEEKLVSGTNYTKNPSKIKINIVMYKF